MSNETYFVVSGAIFILWGFPMESKHEVFFFFFLKFDIKILHLEYIVLGKGVDRGYIWKKIKYS